ncbi:MAG: hypothetical protein ACJ768_17845 [Gaiellaceae bacterium]
MSPRAAMRAAFAAIAVAAAIASTGCGSSSKPAYCSTRSDLEQSVKDLGNVNLKTGGTSALNAQLQKVKSNATELEGSAKGDFPTETAAIQSSVSALDTAVRSLPKSPTVQELAPIAVDVKNVANAVTGFTDATKPKCD